MDTIQVLRTNLSVAHDSFSKTVADLTQAHVDWLPPGIAHPIGERYAHTVVAEDMLVNGFARGAAPWFSSTWQGKTGFENFSVSATAEEARSYKIALAPLHEYARAVFAATEEFLNAAGEEEMARVYDMSVLHLGKFPSPLWWSTFVIGHLHDVMGEISVLKGIQGLKGYPF